ncbi:hypothetical protein [Pyrobaculum sp.]|uniref:hypothetical protein n=1 Tax=Pyrobaculum sp. TaxID=2004705 RepID=UPI0031683960
MRLKVDVVGLSYSPNRDHLVYEIAKIVYDKLRDVRKELHVILITDKKGGDKYVSRATTSLRTYGIEPTVKEVNPVDCPYSCICDNGKPECGVVAEHEVYAAPCVCDGDDWLLMAKCCCGNFRQGVCADFGGPPGCKCIEGENVAECFILFRCPKGSSGSRT